jgi:hypothetical protein
MHQILILTTYVSTVMLRLTILKTRIAVIVRIPPEMEPNPSKDRAKHEGDNPLF